MSYLYLRTETCQMYNRTILFLYTRMERPKLVQYLGELEIFATDRMELFLKIDVDIQVPPSAMKLDKDWHIVTVTLKSEHKKPFSMFVCLFYDIFPHKTHVRQYTDDLFICSGDLDGEPLSEEDLEVYTRLTYHCTETQQNVVDLSKEFRSETHRAENAVDVLMSLAKTYKVQGGQWIMFFQGTPCAKYEYIFDYLIQAFCKKEIALQGNRFNAKIAPDNLIISFGNETTLAARDPRIMKLHEARDFNDGQVCELRRALEGIYNPKILGWSLTMKYKPEIISNCCIQRNGELRPTVYVHSFVKPRVAPNSQARNLPRRS